MFFNLKPQITETIHCRCYNCRREFEVKLYVPLGESTIFEDCSKCGILNKISNQKESNISDIFAMKEQSWDDLVTKRTCHT